MATEETQTLVETAGEIMQGEIDRANETTSQVIAAAGEAIDRAQEQAEEIARAAMETALGRRVASIEEREAEWQNRFDAQALELSNLRDQVSQLAQAVAATATLTVATALQEPQAPQSSSPAISSTPIPEEVIPPITEVIPESLSESIPAAPVVVVPPPRQHRFL
jgi:hypothetical protein